MARSAMWRQQAFWLVCFACFCTALGAGVLFFGNTPAKPDVVFAGAPEIAVVNLITASDSESGEECELGRGDVVRLTQGSTAGDGRTTVKILTSHPGDCGAGTVVVAKLAELSAANVPAETDNSPSSNARPRGALAELDLWQSITNSKNKADYQAYLDQYPGGTFAALARARIAELSPAPAASGLSSAASRNPEILGAAHGWAAYRAVNAGVPICYLRGKPAVALANGKIALSITHRPGEKSFNVVDFEIGYPAADSATAEVDVDGQKFRLFTKDQGAWAPDASTDKKLTEALAAGRTAEIRARSRSGTDVTERYTLAGLGAALTLIDHACSVRR